MKKDEELCRREREKVRFAGRRIERKKERSSYGGASYGSQVETSSD